jgi:hypothetical protein
MRRPRSIPQRSAPGATGLYPSIACKRNLIGKNGMLRCLGLGVLLGAGLGSVVWAQGSAKPGTRAEVLHFDIGIGRRQMNPGRDIV